MFAGFVVIVYLVNFVVGDFQRFNLVALSEGWHLACFHSPVFLPGRLIRDCVFLSMRQ